MKIIYTTRQEAGEAKELLEMLHNLCDEVTPREQATYDRLMEALRNAERRPAHMEESTQ